MNRNYGPIWDTNNVPAGAIKLVASVISGIREGKGPIIIHNALPADWKNGEIYDTGIKIRDVASEYCNPQQCGDQPWN